MVTGVRDLVRVVCSITDDNFGVDKVHVIMPFIKCLCNDIKSDGRLKIEFKKNNAI